MNKNIKMSVPVGTYISYTLCCVLLFLLLLLIKLSNFAYISWFWVFSPLWMPSCILAILLFVIFNAMIICNGIRSRKKYAKKDVYNE